MKILQVHNKYKMTGGEWTVLNQEYDLLSREHSVEQFIVDNNEKLNSFFNKLKLIFTTHYNRASKKRMKRKLLESGVDIMHVHNFFPLLSPSIFEAAREAGIPSVLTLHNYRLIHPNGYLYHKGKIDERSIKGNAYACIPDAVYRDSILQTAVVAHMIEYHRKKKTWNEKVDCFLCLTEFSKSKFVEGGFPEEKISIKPNFVTDALSGMNPESVIQEKASFYVFIGRISEEKGIRTLLKAWNQIKGKSNSELFVIGHGPIENELKKKYDSKSTIKWLGFMERVEIMQYLMKARALIFPSGWYEGMPMTILEAFSACTPVITTNIGSQAEVVRHGQTGLHFEVGSEESLIETIQLFEKNVKLQYKLSKEARYEYEQKYTPEANYTMLTAIYNELLEQ